MPGGFPRLRFQGAAGSPTLRPAAPPSEAERLDLIVVGIDYQTRTIVLESFPSEDQIRASQDRRVRETKLENGRQAFMF